MTVYGNLLQISDKPPAPGKPEPPPCPQCVQLQRRIDDAIEEVSEIVYNPNLDDTLTKTPLMRCTPDLPEIVTNLADALAALLVAVQPCSDPQLWHHMEPAMRKAGAALEAVVQTRSVADTIRTDNRDGATTAPTTESLPHAETTERHDRRD